MTRARLGVDGPSISRIVFGTMGHAETSVDERIRTLHAACDAGSTSIDTAPLYGFGEIERVVGRAIRDRRDRVELLSKVGLRWDGDHGRPLFEFDDAQGVRRTVRRDSRPESIRRDVEGSLTRLATDHLDLCQIHHPDTLVPIAESLDALAQLVQEGKVLHIGVSNFTGAQLEEAARALADGTTRLVSDQLEYNLVKRGAEHEIFPVAREHGIGLLAFSPLDAGSLAGKGMDGSDVRDGRRDRVGFRPVNARAIHAALRECLQPIALAHGATLAQTSLAWLLHQDEVSGVVAGARTPAQAVENAAAAALALDADALEAIDRRFAALRLDTAAGLGWQARARRWLGRVRRRASRWAGGDR